MAAPLNGLVLAGGKSTRMGRDKAFINWHGREQCYHLAELLKKTCIEVFISCNSQQENVINKEFTVIIDRYKEKGPIGALLSAFEYKSTCAWFIVACDLPFLDLKTIQNLSDQRDESFLATALIGANKLPEPLLAIWEPNAFEVLKKDFAKGYLSPQKTLLRNKVKSVRPHNVDALININTPEDIQRFLLQGRS
jgi:molybdopterin-guanine dinucleotide biosynthesis protein A